MSKMTKNQRIDKLVACLRTQGIKMREFETRLSTQEKWSDYADNMLTELNHALPDPEYDAKCEAEVADVETSLDRHRERLGLNKTKVSERDTAKELLEVDLSSELTGSELCKAMLARGDKYVVCFMSYSNDATAEFHENARIVVAHDDKGFYVYNEYYQHAVPINNQGEPLTASEVGL